jgi:hypothetical protein
MGGGGAERSEASFSCQFGLALLYTDASFARAMWYVVSRWTAHVLATERIAHYSISTKCAVYFKTKNRQKYKHKQHMDSSGATNHSSTHGYSMKNTRR